MNKIGILTFVDTINFGASLQAYALQEVIESFGNKAEIISYKNQGVESQEHNRGKIGLKKLVKTIILGGGLKKKREAFRMYEELRVHRGLELLPSTVKLLNEKYDYIVCGSDQVWNMKITANDLTYYLGFVEEDRKKVTYAPSFGNVAFPEEYIETVKKEIVKIPHLSIRERSGADFIKEKFNMTAEVVMDPTLLLTKEEWKAKISFIPNYKHYILVYFPHNKKKVFDFVEKLKKQTGYPVVYLSISPKKQRGVKTIYDASPDEFLGWILHADYIVTGSFHGTAFSINFEKQFFYESSGAGSRINNLIEMMGIKERSIDSEFMLSNVIEYSDVREKLHAEREKSKTWLKTALEG